MIENQIKASFFFFYDLCYAFYWLIRVYSL